MVNPAECDDSVSNNESHLNYECKPLDIDFDYSKVYDIKVVCMNIKGICDKLTISENLESLIDCDVIFLSETWWTPNSKNSKFEINGFTKCNLPRTDQHPKAKRGSGGIIVYIRDNLLDHIKIVKTVCDHFAILEFTMLLGFSSYCVFSYMPPLDVGSHLCKFCDNNFVDMLTDLIVTFSKKGHVSVCGDLNGRTGQLSDEPLCDLDVTTDGSINIDCPSWSTPLPGRVSMDTEVNTRGREILYLCKSSGLRIANGRCFNDLGVGKYTYSMGKNKSVNDYLLVDEVMYGSLSHFDIGVKWPDTDHCPVYFNLKAAHKPTKQPTIISNEKCNKYSKFIWDDDQTLCMYNCLFDEVGTSHIQQFYDSISNLDTSENVALNFNKFITQACQRSLKASKTKPKSNTFPTNPWFDQECKITKANYHNTVKDMCSDDQCCDVYPDDCDCDDHVRQLERDYRKLTRKKKRNFQFDNFMEIQNCKTQKDLWKALNNFKESEPMPETLSMQDFFAHFSKPPIDNSDNKFEFDMAHESQIKELYNHDNLGSLSVNDSSENNQIKLMGDILNSTISESEVTFALSTMKKGKSPGSDGLPVDVFIALSKELSPFLTHLFNYILESGTYPESWSTGIISPVPKVPCPKSEDQFRRISLLPAVSKIFDTIINNRLEFIDSAFALDDIFNGGFKKGSRTSDNLFIMNGIIQKYKTLGVPIYICFVDFKRAFDCINRLFLFAKLHRDGFSGKLLDILFDMYTKTQSKIKWKGFLSKVFQDKFGVNQGGITSPYLFKSFLKDLGKSLDDAHGVVMYKNIIKHLLWADDLYLVSTTAPGIQKQIDNLSGYCKKWQLVVNTMKTKIVIFGRVEIPPDTFTLNGNTIEIAEKYSYVGNQVTAKSNPFSDIESTIIQKCYRSNYKIREYCEKMGQLPPTLAKHFFETLLLPIIEYGSEIWYNRTASEKLSVFQRNYFRRALHVRDKTPNNGVYGDFGIYPLDIRLKNNVIKFLHHVISLPETSPVKWVYHELESLCQGQFDNWVQKAHGIYYEHPISTNFDINSFASLSEASMKAKIKVLSFDNFEKNWASDINDCDKQPKLRTYKNFKTEFRFEPYLNLYSVSLRTAISRFRLSAHHLAIETGRHTKPLTSAEKRFCLVCNNGSVQDEVHHLLICEPLQDLRKPLLESARLCISKFNDLSISAKFVEIMKSANSDLLKHLGTFLIKADQEILTSHSKNK